MYTSQIINELDNTIQQLHRTIQQLHRLKAAYESTDDVPELTARPTNAYAYAYVRDAISKIDTRMFTLDQVKEHLPDDLYLSDKTIGSTILNSGYTKKQVCKNQKRIWHYIACTTTTKNTCTHARVSN